MRRPGTGANQGIGLQVAKELVAHGECGEAAVKKIGPDSFNFNSLIF